MHPFAFGSLNSKKHIDIQDRFLLGILVGFFFITAFTIFQDFLEAHRMGYAFYISESALFNMVWMVFIPCLLLMVKVIDRFILGFNLKTVGLLLGLIMSHLLLLTIVFKLLSDLFYEGKYNIIKILTYTLSNDLNILIIVYTAFIIAYALISNLSKVEKPRPSEKLEHILVKQGKTNVILEVANIYLISALSPYIQITLERKKYLYTDTLASMQDKLDQNVFVRSHKSTIVNLNKIVSYHSRLNGDYDILLNNGSQTRLSRTYFAAFKKVFNERHQVTA